MDDLTEKKQTVLQKLEGLSEGTDSHIKGKRTELWDELIALSNRDKREFIATLSSELQLQPVTIRRWISGEFNPRQAHLPRLRALLGLTQYAPVARANFLGATPDPPVAFDNAFAAVRTLNHFFYCLKLAKYAFLFKGNLSYHAGRPGATRETVIKTLDERQGTLIMYYFYVDGSPAAETFARFVTSPRVQGSHVQEFIRRVVIPTKEDKLGLSYSSISPLILVYDQEGCKAFDRFIDVFFEIPVEFVKGDNRPTDEYSLKTILVQQPEFEAGQFWEKTVEFLKGLNSSNPQLLDDVQKAWSIMPHEKLRQS